MAANSFPESTSEGAVMKSKRLGTAAKLAPRVCDQRQHLHRRQRLKVARRLESPKGFGTGALEFAEASKEHQAEKQPQQQQVKQRKGAGEGRVSMSQDTQAPVSVSRAGKFVCHGCNQQIKDKYVLKACDKYWHDTCLRCHRCQARLGDLGSTLYERANMQLCRQDYFEMFGQKSICAVCNKLIYASEMVMSARQNVYHLECFACQLCGLRFCVGDRFYLCENKIVCQYDYDEHIVPIQESMRLAEQQHQQHSNSRQESSQLGDRTTPSAHSLDATPPQQEQPHLDKLPEEQSNELVRQTRDLMPVQEIGIQATISSAHLGSPRAGSGSSPRTVGVTGAELTGGNLPTDSDRGSVAQSIG